MFSYAIRITLPYDDCIDIISKWASRSQKIIVYQHDADEEVSKTHIHLAVGGCEVKAEALKRMWADAPGKGNEFWSWKEWDGTETYITYMSKGKLRPLYTKNFTDEQVERSRQAWVEPVKADKPGDHSDRMITKIVSHFDSDDFKTHYGIRDMEDEGIPIVTIHNRVRSYAFKQLWAEHRKVPHASFFKIVADSAFLRICERLDRFDEGMGVILNIAI